jgi:hypothetical protein
MIPETMSEELFRKYRFYKTQNGISGIKLGEYFEDFSSCDFMNAACEENHR